MLYCMPMGLAMLRDRRNNSQKKRDIVLIAQYLDKILAIISIYSKINSEVLCLLIEWRKLIFGRGREKDSLDKRGKA